MSHKISIELFSDWHIGSGTGRPGNIDRLVIRDAQGLPYIPAKTLTGILRDSCERVVKGLDNAQIGYWHEWLDFLFGTQPNLAKPEDQSERPPLPAALSIRSAHYPVALRHALSHRQLLKDALVFIKPGVQIDPRSGTAQPNFLRFIEMARGGVTLEASYQLATEQLSQEAQAIALALFTAGCAITDRLGAKRRRGSGRCQIRLDNMPLNQAIATLEQAILTPPAPAPTQVLQIAPPQTQLSDWAIVEFTLTAKSPIIIHDQTLGNLVKTIDYIPGTSLLPILCQPLRSLGIDISSAIAHTELIISHATVELNHQPGRPMPFALFKEKANEAKITNRLGEPLKQSEINQATPQLKGLRSGYVSASPSAPYHLGEVQTGVITHNTVEDASQRPTEAVGGVYSYEAIVPGTRFRARLAIRKSHLGDRSLVDCLTSLENTDAKIGRTKKDDYGLIRITSIQAIAKQSMPAIPSRELKIWLLSDVLLRDRRLRPTSDPQALVAALSQVLDVSLQLQPQCLNTLTREHRTDSWQTRWGLPRPSLVGLKAGSCLLLEVTAGSIQPEKLEALIVQGIGERRVEGYGQISINDPLLIDNDPSLEKVDANTSNINALMSIPQASPIHSTAKLIEQIAWREAIRREALGIAANPDRRHEILGLSLQPIPQPTMSQLGGLRSLLRDIPPTWTEGYAQTVEQWVVHTKTKQRNKWDEIALNKLKTLLTGTDAVWKHLNLPERDLSLTEQGSVNSQQALWGEAVETLLIACIRAHKRDSEKNLSSQKGA